MAFSSIISKLNPIVVQPTSKHTASLIFLHGSEVAVVGSDGNNMKQWIEMVLGENLAFPHIKIIYPTAPLRPYTAANGAPVSVWFDRLQISPFVEEDHEGLQVACNYVQALVDAENAAGIKNDHIVVGGFSMGGCLALHYSYRHGHNIAGTVAFSSFLNQDSQVYEVLKNKPEQRRPPLLMCHGQRDNLVLFEWGQNTHSALTKLNVTTNFYAFANLFHELNRKEVKTLKDWLQLKLPE